MLSSLFWQLAEENPLSEMSVVAEVLGTAGLEDDDDDDVNKTVIQQ
jgi:hypothetical protein